MDDKDVLIHYGKLGMRWGRRSGSSESSDSVSTRTIGKKKAKNLSNAELKQVVERLNLEKKYKEVNPKGLSKANKIVLGVLAAGTTVNAAIAFAGSPAGQRLASFVKNAATRGNVYKGPVKVLKIT